MSAIDKLANHVDSPLARLRKLSPSVTHAFNEYPVFYESVNFLLSVAFINYLATFSAEVVLSLKKNILDVVLPQLYDLTSSLDEWFTKVVLVGELDKYAPFLKTTHLKDFKPSALKSASQKYYKSLVEYIKTKSASLQSYVKSTADPIVANTVSSVNPVLAPVNKTLESVIDQYLPSASSTTTSDITKSTDDNQVTKLISLTRDATGRTITVVHTTASKALKIPSNISEHVSKIYGSELKERHSIPSAIVHTSSELVSEVTNNLGLKQKANAASQIVESKVNGIVESTNDAANSVRSAVEKVAEQGVNGEISVSA